VQASTDDQRTQPTALFASCVLDPVATSVAKARAFVLSTLDGQRSEDPDPAEVERRDTLALLTSEVVTNVVLHARTPFQVLVWRNGDVVRVGVRDRSWVEPAVKDAGMDDEGGRGLMLVDTLATSWGTTLEAVGKVVWFEL
jgi:hypothetical protein